MRLYLMLIVLLPVIQSSFGDAELNNRPIVAVLAQIPYNDTRSYIAASYVKFLESSGARVIPVPSSMSEEEVAKIFDGVNGVLFPGGSANMGKSQYYKHAKSFFDKAIAANKEGDYFPIWGTCLGFETLHVLAAGDRPDILSTFSAEDISLSLNYTNAARGSRLFRDMPVHLYKSLGMEDITYNHHHGGVSPDTYAKESSLKSFYNVLSINNGEAGKTFVSTVEAFHYPFYGVQWHPEKNNFEFNTDEHIPHTIPAVQASQYMSNFIVNEARKSKHHFTSEEDEQKYLIYKYQPEYTHTGHFEQEYFFK